MHLEDDDKTVLGGFSLEYSIQSDSGENYILNREAIVGRASDCDVLIDDKKISRKHALLKIGGEQLQVTDLGSSNGTFVNGEKISSPTNLVNGDIISLEKHNFTVKIVMDEIQINGQYSEEILENHADMMDLTDDDFERINQAAENTGAFEASQEDSEQAEESEKLPKNKEQVPSSWIEETGAVAGTRMLDMKELNALRAGSNEVIHNDSQITRLHCFVEGQDEEIIELPVTDFNQASGWEIGRDSACDIVLNHPSVSSRHAQIIHQNGRWKIVNLVSTNGILINGQKRLSTYLSDGDKVVMGSAHLILKIPKSQHRKANIPMQKPRKGSSNLVFPIFLGLIIIALMMLIYFYVQ